MGKYQKRRGKKGRRNKGSYNNSGNDNEDFVAATIERGNYKMEAYYAAQGLHNMRWSDSNELVPCKTDKELHAERLTWKHCIGKILPASFRLAKDVPHRLKDQMEADLEEMLHAFDKNSKKEKQEGAVDDSAGGQQQQEEEEEEEAEPKRPVISKLQFLPHAYQLGMDRTTIRKDAHLATLHEWLKQQTDAGYITRQETVSMIPTVVLAPQPADYVLDMCAAPGSKTSQILEKLGPTGAIVANDSNNKRAHMLVSQLRRIMHMNPAVLVTNCVGQFFPAAVQFDRILCDVPCSGDGTSRKNISVWAEWTQRNALALHNLQLDIAWKGVSQLLKSGGMFVYSTCSFNPIENEAVVAELLRLAGGQLELVDYQLEGFRTRPGWSTWNVFCEDKTQREYRNERNKNNAKMQAKRAAYEQAEKEAAGQKNDGDKNMDEDEPAEADPGAASATANEHDEEDSKPAAQPDGPAPAAAADEAGEASKDSKNDGGDDDEIMMMEDLKNAKFEPTSMDEAELIKMLRLAGVHHFPSHQDVPKHLRGRVRSSCFPPTQAEAKQFNLQRCIRCLPQDNDTGGFFVALLRKKGEVSKTDRVAAKAAATAAAAAATTEKAATETTAAAAASPSSEEPATKRTRVDPETANDGVTNDETKMEADPPPKDDAANAGDETKKKGDGAAAPDTNTNGDGVRGVAKGNYCRDENGKALEMGKDDFIAVSDDVLNTLVTEFGLTESETFSKELLMTRASGKEKVIYYIPRPIKDLIDRGLQKRVTVINAGLKAFSRSSHEGKSIYRVCQEAAHVLAPHMSHRALVVDLPDFSTCLTEERFIEIDKFSESVQAKLRALSVGSFVLVFDGFKDELDETMVVTMWRCRSDRLDGLIGKVEMKAIRTKIQALQGSSTHQPPQPKTDEQE